MFTAAKAAELCSRSDRLQAILDEIERLSGLGKRCLELKYQSADVIQQLNDLGYQVRQSSYGKTTTCEIKW